MRERDEPVGDDDLKPEGDLSDFWAPANLRDRTMRSMKLTRISGGTAESGTARVSARNSPAVTLSTRGTITPGVSTRYRGGLDAIRKADTWRVTPGIAPTRATFDFGHFFGRAGGERGGGDDTSNGRKVHPYRRQRVLSADEGFGNAPCAGARASCINTNRGYSRSSRKATRRAALRDKVCWSLQEILQQIDKWLILARKRLTFARRPGLRTDYNTRKDSYCGVWAQGPANTCCTNTPPGSAPRKSNYGRQSSYSFYKLAISTSMSSQAGRGHQKTTLPKAKKKKRFNLARADLDRTPQPPRTCLAPSPAPPPPPPGPLPRLTAFPRSKLMRLDLPTLGMPTTMATAPVVANPPRVAPRSLAQASSLCTLVPVRPQA